MNGDREPLHLFEDPPFNADAGDPAYARGLTCARRYRCPSCVAPLFYLGWDAHVDRWRCTECPRDVSVHRAPVPSRAPASSPPLPTHGCRSCGARFDGMRGPPCPSYDCPGNVVPL